MYFIIVGAGAVTKHLIKIAQEGGHDVAVIEKKEERAREIMGQFDIRVFHGDIAQENILQEAQIKKADAIIATTKDDSVNLMAMLLGKNHDVEHLVTMVQNNEHTSLFENLGVKVLANPERIIAKKLHSFINSEKD